MATLTELENALRNAHNAGDAHAARTFALEIKRKRSASPVTEASVADEYGPVRAGVVSAGRTLDRLYTGAKDMALTVPAKFGNERAQSARREIEQEQADNTRHFAALEAKHPVATTVGGAAPLLAAPVFGTGALGMAAGASLPGLIEYGTPQEKLTRGALGAAGGAAGALIGKGVSKVLRPTAGVPNAAIGDAVEAAERIGYKTPAGQATGSRVLQAIEQQVAKHPSGAGVAQRFNEANTQAVNRAASRAMGENSPKLTDDVLASATKRVGGVFDDVSSRNTVNVANDGIMAALTTLDEQQRALGSFAQPSVTSLVDKGLDLAAKGQVEGKTYQIIRSELGKQAKSAYGGQNSTLGDALKSIQRALDSAADDSISAADREMWSTARKQWQALKLVNTKNGIVEGGNVSAAKLATKVDKAGTVRAQELRDIAKIGETFKPLPDSGTASNAMMQLLLTGGAGLAGPATLAASLLAPAAVSKAVFSDAGRAYLTRGLLSLTPAQKRMLELTGSGLLSSGATTYVP